MSVPALTRTNLLLETGKVRRLRRALQSRSNSEAVRRVIDERLAAEAGLQALQNLRKLGGPEDVFGRAPAKRECLRYRPDRFCSILAFTSGSAGERTTSG